MLKKFIDGLLFGAGFALAFIILWYAAAYWIAPQLISAQIDSAIAKDERLDRPIRPSETQVREWIEERPPFHELNIDEQIKKASVIAIAKYEQSSSGATKAVFREFLKRNPSVEFHYKVGDEYPDLARSLTEDVDYGEGLIVFFVGSPASMRRSITYSRDRIRGLGDMPIELMRKKCKSPDA